MEETLEADSDKDSITLEFKQEDGALITFVADFKQDVKIFRSLILGEPECGQSQVQALCFITRLNHNDIVPSLSMGNPHVIRVAEERQGVEELTMNVAVNLSRAWQLSAHIPSMCSEALYTTEADAKHWLDRGVEGSMFEMLSQTMRVSDLRACPSSPDAWQPCTCSYGLRLEWYPCLPKYCRERRRNTAGNAAGNAGPHKCAVKSCSKGYRFTYYVAHRQLCLWDEGT
ncbi:hypothetical protein AAFF_G00440700 [Aldrovandia affinis]|uniref:Out at first protein homolog n=1 Tax=Aldrovandia affinis TaxID=143900 RepID=A0AAD7S9I2_9TELE|nr:hypothetical protein AAFF_G00440700 [Aldrovandia affinis]